MRKILETFYGIWTFVAFCFWFVLLFPAFFTIVQKEKWHRYGYQLNKIWAHLVYGSILMPVKVVHHSSIDRKKQYVYCPNHNSYFDIPIIGFSAPQFVVFVGKNSLSKLPLFGYMFRKLHIPVDRANRKSRSETIQKSLKAIDNGHSLLIFPEGGINVENCPDLKNFKDGAFRIAIQKQIPIVPVTIPFNWIILHDVSTRLKWHRVKIVFHEPIETKGMTLNNIEELREQVRTVIRNEMQAHFPDLLPESTHMEKENESIGK